MTDLPDWVQYAGALGAIAVAFLALVTLIYSERFRAWTRRLRRPTPVLAEAWVQQLAAPLRHVLHLGLVNPGEAPLVVTRVAAKLFIYPSDLTLPGEYLRIPDRALIKPRDASSLEFTLKKGDPDLIAMVIDHLNPAACGLAIEYVSGNKTRVLSWEIPKIGDSISPILDSGLTELLPLMHPATPRRFSWLSWARRGTKSGVQKEDV